ncbi:hypothetical protein HY251_10195 [bacterium]|nr:hypothetical protein [bacterium]
MRALTRAALVFLDEHGLTERPCRFDVFSVLARSGGKLEVAWSKAAFSAAGDDELESAEYREGRDPR